jgi:hypothetical protein
MDSMMRSYVMDLAENFAGGAAMGRGMPQRHRPMGQMRFRMISTDASLRNGGAGGVLLIGQDGRVAAASPGAEKLLFLRTRAEFSDEPEKVRGDDGNDYYVAKRGLEDGSYILAAVSRTVLIAPLAGIWRTWILTAMATSAAIFLGMILLWRYLAVPLRRIAERIRGCGGEKTTLRHCTAVRCMSLNPCQPLSVPLRKRPSPRKSSKSGT